MKNILLTGYSGFLGKHIRQYLDRSGADVSLLGRDPAAQIRADLSTDIVTFKRVFDIVIHAAGKAHVVPKSESEKDEFYKVNVQGTANLLKSLEKSVLPQSFIFISSVAVYGCEEGDLVNTFAPLLAKDPYGRSKIEAEELVLNWCAGHGITCSILRLPLVAGPRPPGNLGAMIAGIKKGFYFDIEGGQARKSVVLANDVAAILPTVAGIGGIYNLTDGHHPSFFELSGLISLQLERNRPLNMPLWLAKILAKAGDLLGAKAPLNSRKLEKILSNLTFDDSEARKMLGWNPTQVLEGFKIY